MTEQYVRLSDVADEIVQSYLHRLLHRISGTEIKNAWFRVVQPNLRLPINDGESVALTPTFEVLLTVTQQADGLARALATAATDMAGRVNVFVDAVLDGIVTSEDLTSGGWTETEVPRFFDDAGHQQLLNV